jgi:hypothetical protein
VVVGFQEMKRNLNELPLFTTEEMEDFWGADSGLKFPVKAVRKSQESAMQAVIEGLARNDVPS